MPRAVAASTTGATGEEDFAGVAQADAGPKASPPISGPLPPEALNHEVDVSAASAAQVLRRQGNTSPAGLRAPTRILLDECAERRVLQPQDAAVSGGASRHAKDSP